MHAAYFDVFFGVYCQCQSIHVINIHPCPVGGYFKVKALQLSNADAIRSAQLPTTVGVVLSVYGSMDTHCQVSRLQLVYGTVTRTALNGACGALQVRYRHTTNAGMNVVKVGHLDDELPAAGRTAIVARRVGLYV